MFWGPNSTFVEVTGEKLVGGAFLTPSWIGLNKVASLKPDALLKETPAQLFSWDFRDIFKNTC